MKKLLYKSLFALSFTFLFIAFNSTAHAQGVGRTSDVAVMRDPILEQESMHNLVVARHYFKAKKAYRASLARAEEIIAGNPNFARLDETLFIAGMSSLRLSQDAGKQKSNLPADKMREQARQYLSQLVKDFPASDFKKEAESELNALGGAVAVKQ